MNDHEVSEFSDGVGKTMTGAFQTMMWAMLMMNPQVERELTERLNGDVDEVSHALDHIVWLAAVEFQQFLNDFMARMDDGGLEAYVEAALA